MSQQFNQLQFVVAEENDIRDIGTKAAPVGVPPIDNGMWLQGDNLTFEDLIEANNKFEAFKTDHDELHCTNLRLDPQGGFTINGDGYFGQNYGIEDHALKQLCQRLGYGDVDQAIPYKYARALIDNYPAQYSEILAGHAAGYGKSVFVRTYADQIRGYMSDRFTHIDHKDILDLITGPLSEKYGQYKLVRPYIGRDSMTVRITLKDYNIEGGDVGGSGNSVYGVGVVIRNGEKGNTSPGVYPFIQRTSCTNSTVWQEGGLTIRQNGHREVKLTQLAAGIYGALQASHEMLKRHLDQRVQKLPTIDSVIEKMADAYGWSEAVQMNVGIGTEGERTMSGLMNGITYAAHKATGENAEAGFELESLAGRLSAAGIEYVSSQYGRLVTA